MSAAEGWGSGVHSGREGGGGAEAAEDGATCAAELSKIPQSKRRVDGEDFVIICSAIVPDEGRNQKPSEVIRGHQRPSVAIRGHQRLSEVIRGHQRPSEAIKGHQRPSEAIKGHQRPSEAIRGHQRQSEVIRGHQALTDR